MMDILINLLGLLFSVVSLGVGVGLLKRLSLKRKAENATRGMDSGLYIKQGMTVDQETGEAVPTKRPSEEAINNLVE